MFLRRLFDLGPAIVQKERVDYIIMNPIYEKEIKAEARKRGFRGKFVSAIA